MATSAYLVHEDGTRCPGTGCQECPNDTCGCHKVDCEDAFLGKHFKSVECPRHALPKSNGFLEAVRLADISLAVLESFAAKDGGGGVINVVDTQSGAECFFFAQEVRAEIEHRKALPKKRETDPEKFARLGRLPIELVSAEEKHFLKYCRLPANLRPRFSGAK
jgi:hypothetical protein